MTIANQSGAVFGITAGIARKLDLDASAKTAPVRQGNGPGTLSNRANAPGTIQGGGDLNGTAATSILHGQAGTDASRWQAPRKFSNPGNWCGIV